MTMKNKKGFWENVFLYPSFNLRFFSVVFLILFIFLFMVRLVVPLIGNFSDKISVLSLFTSLVTLVLGILAAYYALRQLVEARFTGLDEGGLQELKNKRYFRAIRKWKEAFYIRPDSGVFCNLAEAYLLIADFDSFDQHLKNLSAGALIQPTMFQEESDRLIILYLEIVRQLLVENLGEAKKKLTNLVKLCLGAKLVLNNFGWDFRDLTSSDTFNNLPTGESKIILNNLILYLQKKISPLRKKEFDEGNFASQNAQ